MNFSSVKKLLSIHDNSKYTLSAVLDDGKIISVPLDLDNRHYAEIMRQVDAGTLTIQEAD